MGIADVLAARKANKRMGKLMKALQRNPGDKDIKAELWFRCREWQQHGSAAWGWNPPREVASEVGAAIALQDRIEEELGLTGIIDRIEHLLDPLELQSLRAEADQG